METVKIENKEYPVKFGMAVIRAFAKLKGYKTLDDFEKWYTGADPSSLAMIDDITDLLLLGIRRGCRKDNIECNIEADDLLDLMQDDEAEFVKLRHILEASISGEPEAPPAHKKSSSKKTVTKKK
jgi:hypothetical protein